MENGESVIKVENSEIQSGFGASFRRVTPSTHVGRLSESHFELGFSVNAIATLGRKAIEQHGEKSDNLEVFEHRLFHLTRLHTGGGELTA